MNSMKCKRNKKKNKRNSMKCKRNKKKKHKRNSMKCKRSWNKWKRNNVEYNQIQSSIRIIFRMSKNYKIVKNRLIFMIVIR